LVFQRGKWGKNCAIIACARGKTKAQWASANGARIAPLLLVLAD